jgi:hypothetical protein
MFIVNLKELIDAFPAMPKSIACREMLEWPLW